MDFTTIPTDGINTLPDLFTLVADVAIFVLLKVTSGNNAKTGGETQKQIENNTGRLELLEKSTISADKYRLTKMLDKIEGCLNKGGDPTLNDILVVREIYAVYKEMGGNGAVETRFNEIMSRIRK
ncbi:MAG: hypothetical protein LBN42_00780 [Oscillospiraceae bacterium]|nr:hypothetical protein [Oscillospiraceae bacterium]